MIHINNLHKSYGETVALKDITLQVNEGELFGLIGPDGAGKTTLMRILMSLMLPDGGIARLDGLDVCKDYKQVRQITGYMPGRFSLYLDLSVEENLEFFATVFDTTIEENYDLINDIYCQIEPFKKRRAGKLSGGMKQKLALSCALIHKPKVLILDEPTTGVDAVSRKEFWEMLMRLKKQGITILVSTPYMDEASLCDRIALIQEGHIFTVDTPEKIAAGFHEDIWAIKSPVLYETSKKLQNLPNMISVNSFGQELHLVTPKGLYSESSISDFLKDAGEVGFEINTTKASIEDVFILFMNGTSPPDNYRVLPKEGLTDAGL
ncbi:ABC transporter ATP-binding protein [Parabacteroides sp. FAFU027]|uniref:ABC transporter ATP-binding protein n=1 Tax=Parabacteroides sp. FAFU027 TaxID=2922715 RepID=UPI001FAFF12F|nr:ABC transporter ATP-binding protein [Parabacteroides sp. FAFU027]